MPRLRFGETAVTEHHDGHRSSRTTVWLGDKLLGAIEGDGRGWRVVFLAASGFSAPAARFATLAEAKAEARRIVANRSPRG